MKLKSLNEFFESVCRLIRPSPEQIAGNVRRHEILMLEDRLVLAMNGMEKDFSPTAYFAMSAGYGALGLPAYSMRPLSEEHKAQVISDCTQKLRALGHTEQQISSLKEKAMQNADRPDFYLD